MKKTWMKSRSILAARGVVSLRFSANHLSRPFFSHAAIAKRSRPDEIPGPDPVCLDPFRRPLRPCRGGHAISRSRGSITKVGTHFHVAATRRTGYLFFSCCLSSLWYPVSRRSCFANLLISFWGNRLFSCENNSTAIPRTSHENVKMTWFD